MSFTAVPSGSMFCSRSSAHVSVTRSTVASKRLVCGTLCGSPTRRRPARGSPSPALPPSWLLYSDPSPALPPSWLLYSGFSPATARCVSSAMRAFGRFAVVPPMPCAASTAAHAGVASRAAVPSPTPFANPYAAVPLPPCAWRCAAPACVINHRPNCSATIADTRHTISTLAGRNDVAAMTAPGHSWLVQITASLSLVAASGHSRSPPPPPLFGGREEGGVIVPPRRGRHLRTLWRAV